MQLMWIQSCEPTPKKLVDGCHDLLKSASRHLAVKAPPVDWTWDCSCITPWQGTQSILLGRSLASPAVTRLQIFTLDGDNLLDPIVNRMITSPRIRAPEKQEKINSSIDWGNR